jgi:hypothetical protein
MRYYFHVLGVGRTYKDDEGMACKNAEHAKGHAQFMAYELFRLLGEEFRSDQRVTAISVLVTDEMGNEITRAPLRLGCRWLHWFLSGAFRQRKSVEGPVLKASAALSHPFKNRDGTFKKALKSDHCWAIVEVLRLGFHQLRSDLIGQFTTIFECCGRSNPFDFWKGLLRHPRSVFKIGFSRVDFAPDPALFADHNEGSL